MFIGHQQHQKRNGNLTRVHPTTRGHEETQGFGGGILWTFGSQHLVQELQAAKPQLAPGLKPEASPHPRDTHLSWDRKMMFKATRITMRSPVKPLPFLWLVWFWEVLFRISSANAQPTSQGLGHETRRALAIGKEACAIASLVGGY